VGHGLIRFLGGVLDFSGELNRYAVARATRRDTREVQRCRDLVEGLMGEFLQVRSTQHPFSLTFYVFSRNKLRPFRVVAHVAALFSAPVLLACSAHQETLADAVQHGKPAACTALSVAAHALVNCGAAAWGAVRG
jgi:hypothetical protein